MTDTAFDWESLPDVPTSGDSKGASNPLPAAFDWEALPDIEVPAAPVAPGQMVDQPADPYAMDTKPVALKTDPDIETIGDIMRIAQEAGGNDEVGILHVAEKLGVESDMVRRNYAGFKKAAELAGFDPARWKQENPILARLVLDRPDMGKVVMVDQQLSPVTRFLKGLLAAREQIAQYRDDRLLAQTGNQNAQARLDSGEYDKPINIESSRPVQMLENNKTEAFKKLSGFDQTVVATAQRLKEANLQMDVAELSYRRLKSVLGLSSEDETQLAQQVHDLKLRAVPLNLGDSTLISDAAQGVVSTTRVIPETLKGAGAGAGAMALLGGGLTYAATRSPAAAGEAATQGLKLGAKLGAGAGTFRGSFVLESGSTFDDLLNTKTDDGRPLTKEQAAGAAIIAGALKAGIEVAQFEALKGMTTSFAPLLKNSTIKALVTSNPAFRSYAASVAKQFLKSGGEFTKDLIANAAEEVAQEAVDQVTQYVAPSVAQGSLSERPVFNTEKLSESGWKGLVGGAVLGGVGPALTVTAAVATHQRSEQENQQVPVILDIGKTDIAQAAPGPVANAIETETGVKALYVDPKAIKKFYQDNGASDEAADAHLAEILGPDAPQKVNEALATGGKVEIPLSAAISSWSVSEMSQALKGDTTMSPDLLTPNELKASKEIEATAAAIAAPLIEETQVEARINDTLQARKREQVATLVANDVAPTEANKRAATQAALDKAFWLKLREGLTPAQAEEQFNRYQVETKQGDEQARASEPGALTQPADAVNLTERAAGLTPEQKALEANIDPLTNLRLYDAWVKLPRTPGTKVAALTTPDLKAVNDNPVAGHDVANTLLKYIGSSIPMSGSRKGTTFVFEVADQAELDAIVAKIHVGIPKGMQVISMLKETPKEATDKLREFEKKAEKSKRLPKRGTTNYDTRALSPETNFAVDVKLAEPIVTQEMIEAAASVSPEQHVKASYLDAAMPGVLTRLGFEAQAERSHVVALDLRGLKDANEKLGLDEAEGRQIGDRILADFARAAMAMGGEDLFFAHFSGDEFAAKSNDKAKLEEYAANLRAYLEANTFGVQTRTGISGDYEIRFRYGIGERTYGAADRDLNARKQRESEKPGNASEAPVPGRTGVGDGAAGTDTAGTSAQAAGDRGAEAGSTASSSDGNAPANGKVKLYAGNPSAPKGYTTIEQRGTKRLIGIFLNRNSDFSTQAHEGFHAYLDILADQVANNPALSQANRDNFAALLKWLGAETYADVTTEMQEKAARAFEGFLLEGKAPSSKLGKVFERAKRWMLGVYRSVASVTPDLNDEARAIFGRMLATEEQMESLARRAGLQAPTIEQGATPEEVETWQYELSQASRKAELAVLKERQRTNEKWWKSELARLTEEFGQAYEALPAYVAQQALIDGEVVMDRAEVEKVIGTLKVKGVRTAANGISPLSLAREYGFQNATQFLAAMAALPPKETWVKREVDARMNELHPGLLQRREELNRLLADGLQQLSEQRIAQEARFSDVEKATLKRAAEIMVEARQLNNLRPDLALSAERRAANDMARAAGKGQWLLFREAAERRLINAYLYGMLLDATDIKTKLETVAAAATKQTARARMGLAAPEYRDGIDFILGAVGLGPATDLGIDAIDKAAQLIRDDASGDAAWVEDLKGALEKQDWARLSVAEAQTVLDAIANIQRAARDRNTITLEDRRVSIEAAVKEAIETMAIHRRKKTPPSTNESKSLGERFSEAVDWAGSYVRGVPDLIRDATGDNQTSVLWKLTVGALRAAKYKEVEMLKKVAEKYLQAIEDMPDEVRAHLYDKVDGAELFPTHMEDQAPPRKRFELLMMALNMGNESNEQRLLDGRRISREQVVNALNDLTTAELKWVQDVFDILEELGPQAFDVEERITGIRPKKIPARPLVLKNGTLRGGYFPAVYERSSAIGERQVADSLAALDAPEFVRATTPHSHVKARAGQVNAVISLSPSIIQRHIQQVIHDISHREAVRNVGRFIFHPEMDQAFKRYFGQKNTEVIKGWLRDTALGKTIEGTDNPLFRLANRLRANMAPAILGYSLGNAIGDLANIPASLSSTPLTARALGDGMREFIKSPTTAVEWARANSAEFRTMDKTFQLQFGQAFDSIVGKELGKKGILGWLKEHAFVFQEAVQTASATPILIGAYRQGLEQGLAEKEAMVFAEDILTRVFPSHSAVEQSKVMRDKGFIGMLVVFGGYLNLALRQLINISRDVRDAQFDALQPSDKAKLVVKRGLQAAAFLATVGPLSAFLMGKGPEDGDRDPDEQDDETLKWRNWFLRRLLVDSLSLFPLLGSSIGESVGGAMLGRQLQAPRPDVLQSLLFQFARTYQKVGAAIQSRDAADVAKLIPEVLRVIGAVTGLPTNQSIKTFGYLLGDTATEDNVGRQVGGIIYGRRGGSPENPFQMIGDAAQGP